MYLTEKEMKRAIDAATSIGEAIENLYKLIFNDWDEISKIEGWPKVGRLANKKIMELLNQKFGREALFIWVNKGFGTLDEDSFRVSLGEVEVKYYPTCPWCGKRHPEQEHYQCAPDYGLEAAYEERFEME